MFTVKNHISRTNSFLLTVSLRINSEHMILTMQGRASTFNLLTILLYYSTYLHQFVKRSLITLYGYHLCGSRMSRMTLQQPLHSYLFTSFDKRRYANFKYNILL
jgi:hypothetical protein